MNRLKVFRISSENGSLSLSEGAEIWLDKNGMLCGDGIWFDLLVPYPSDIIEQAKTKQISPLEWLRQRLLINPYLRVEIQNG